MRIGLTGATGFIGQQLLKEYADCHTFVAATSHADVDSFYEHPNIRYVRSDYSVDSYRSIFAGCDCIVHLGAKRFSAENEKRFINYIENITASECLFEAACSLGIKNIVNISTISVYNPSQELPYKEAQAHPFNRYGISKLCIEELAGLYNRKSDMHIKSLRLAQVIGLGERGGYLLAVYLERSIGGQTLDVFGLGASAKEYIYIKDVTAAIMCACLKETLGGSFNIGTGKATTNLQLAQAFCSVFSNQGGFKLQPEKQEDGLVYCMDVSHAKEALGFTAEYGLYDALCDMKRELEEKK